MVVVSYTCPYCDAVHELDRPPVLADRSVTATPIEEYTYAGLTDEDREDADGIELVCGVDDRIGTDRAGETPEGCGRQFYLNFVRYEEGQRVDDGPWLEDSPRFDFRP